MMQDRDGYVNVAQFLLVGLSLCVTMPLHAADITLDDFGVGPRLEWSGEDQGDEDSQAFCVQTLAPEGIDYRITVDGGGSGAFRMTSGPFKLPYDARWRDGSDRTVDLEDGQTVSGLSSAGGGSDAAAPCDGGSNARLIVSVGRDDFARVPAGTYVDNLNILVSVE